MYEMHNQITFINTGADNHLKLSSAFSMMMDSCQFQEQQEKAFCAYLRSHHLAIFLFSIQIDINRFPEFCENVTTCVKIYGCKSIYGLRRITMRDESGNICLIANATGAFFDTLAGKAAKIKEEDICLHYDEPEDMECLPRKIAIPPFKPSILPPYLVTRSRLDPNGHLTSPEYAAMAFDRLPDDYRFNRVRFEFKQQAKLGEIIQPVLYDDEKGKIVIDMQNFEGKSCAIAEFSSKDI